MRKSIFDIGLRGVWGRNSAIRCNRLWHVNCENTVSVRFHDCEFMGGSLPDCCAMGRLKFFAGATHKLPDRSYSGNTEQAEDHTSLLGLSKRKSDAGDNQAGLLRDSCSF